MNLKARTVTIRLYNDVQVGRLAYYSLFFKPRSRRRAGKGIATPTSSLYHLYGAKKKTD